MSSFLISVTVGTFLEYFDSLRESCDSFGLFELI
jgi:hypothetical protein